MDKETAKLLRHLPLGLTIDGLIGLTIGLPLWVMVSDPNASAVVLGMWWWPWAAAVTVGLTVYYGICEDRLLVETVAEAPKLILYAVILLVTAPWWVPQVSDYETSLTPNPSPDGRGEKETQ